MKKVIISVMLVLLISAGVGFVLQELLNSFWRGVVLSVTCHFIAVVVMNAVARKKGVISQLEDVLSNIIDLQTVTVTCPCGKGVYEAPLFMNKENVFECDACNSTFRVDVDYDTVLQTNQPNINDIYDTLQAERKKGTVV